MDSSSNVHKNIFIFIFIEKQCVLMKTWSPPPWLGVLSLPPLLNDLFLTKYNLHYKNRRGEHNFIRDPLLHN